MTTTDTGSVAWNIRKRRIAELCMAIRDPESVKGVVSPEEARGDAAVLLVTHVPELVEEIDRLRATIARQAPVVEAACEYVDTESMDDWTTMAAAIVDYRKGTQK